MQKRWYNLTPEQISEQLNTDTAQGLSRPEAKTRLEKNGDNDVFSMPENSFSSYFKAVSKDITGYLMICSAVVAVIFAQDVSAIVLLALLLINFVSSLAFYSKSAKLLHDMAKIASPVSRVIRDSHLLLVNQRKIAVGDIIILGEGDIVPCDCRVISSDGLCVLEKNLTGVGEAVAKDGKMIYGLSVPVTGQKDMVFATSLVTSGRAKVIACAVGKDTYAYENGLRPEIVTHDKLDILKIMKKYCTTWGLTMLCMILLLTGLDLYLGLKSRSLFDIYISGLSLAVAAMTEMYVVFGYFCLGAGLNSAIKKPANVISGAAVKNVERIDKIKEITTLIVPKRGGFFSDSTSVEMLWCNDTAHRVSERNLFKYCGRLVKYAMLSTGYNGANKQVLFNPANDACAIVETAEKIGLDRDIVASENPCLDYTQIELSEQQCDLSLIALDDEVVALAKGDALRLLEKCCTFYADGKIKEMSDRDRRRISDSIISFRDKGYRALGVISRKSEIFLAGGIDAELCDWNFEGYAILRDTMLYGAAENVELCKKAGIHVMMLCDETSEQNRIYAKKLGIISDSENTKNEILTSKEMSAITDDEFNEKLPNYGLCEGLSFIQKKLLISHLQDMGEIVGFLATELDETILLKKADVGYTGALALSNGESTLDLGSRNSPIYLHNTTENPAGCEALKYVCDVLVSPPDRKFGGFNAIVSTVASAKNIYRNILNTVKYLITSQLTRFLIVLFSVLASNFGISGNVRMLTSPQVLLSGLIVDFSVVLAISYRTSKKNALSDRAVTEKLEKPFIHNFKPMVFSLIWASLISFSPKILNLLGKTVKSDHITAMVFVSFILSQVIVAWEIMNEESVFGKNNRINYAFMMIASFAVVFVGALQIPIIGKLFDFVFLDIYEWICVIAILITVFAVYEIYKLLKKLILKAHRD